MPLQRFWNAWLCVLTSPATAIRPFASMTLPARVARPLSLGPIHEISPPATSIDVPGTTRYCSPFAPPRIAVALVTTRSACAGPSPVTSFRLSLTRRPPS